MSGIFDTSSVSYLQNENIDRAKWDKCIDIAPNGLIYAYSFYLDTMAKNWDALVMNDYEAVMPITWNKKYGIYYLYQPFLCASLGLFGKNITSERLSGFLNKIPKRFKYWDISLNKDNFFLDTGFDMYSRTNHILDLNHSYSFLFNKYRNSYKQILNKVDTNGIVLRKNISINYVIELAKKQFKNVTSIPNQDFENFIHLYNSQRKKLNPKNYALYINNELMASGIFLFSHDRAYYMLAGNNPEGRTFKASHIVIDAFIKDYAGTNLVLDFEGSDVRSISFFFKGFGAKEEIYPGLKYNALPSYIRWMKK
jgi:hypothetical protein